MGLIDTVLSRRGNPLAELARMPLFWHRLRQVSTEDLEVRKVGYGEHPRQYLLFCTQRDVPVSRPPVLYMHGGGWRFGSPERFIPNAQVLTSRGHPVVLFSHRKIPTYNAMDMREDLGLMLQFILAAGEEEPIWEGPWIIGGMSSGGNLAALLVFDEDIYGRRGISQSFFAGIFLLGAPLDLCKMFPSLTLRQFAGKRDSALFRKANPVEHLKAKNVDLPILILHGDKDGLVEYENAQSFANKLKALQAPRLAFPSLRGFAHLDKAAWSVEDGKVRQLLLDWMDEVSEKAYCQGESQ